jgi:hypothetical protein
MSIYKGSKIAFFSGESSTFTPTSTYVTYAEVPGTARNLVFEVYAGSTGVFDVRLVQAMPRLDAQTSDLNYKFPATTYSNKSSTWSFNTTKGAYMFAFQARQSTDSTSFATPLQIKWMGIS